MHEVTFGTVRIVGLTPNTDAKKTVRNSCVDRTSMSDSSTSMSRLNPQTRRLSMPVSYLKFALQFFAESLALLLCLASPARCATPKHVVTLICTNPFSHVTWPLHIDFYRHTVDSTPAQIGSSAISWFGSTHGRHYTLNRNTGRLTVVIASSTGGYFLHDHCAISPITQKH